MFLPTELFKVSPGRGGSSVTDTVPKQNLVGRDNTKGLHKPTPGGFLSSNLNKQRRDGGSNPKPSQDLAQPDAKAGPGEYLLRCFLLGQEAADEREGHESSTIASTFQS